MPTYGDLADAAIATLVGKWYTAGHWRVCSQDGCPVINQDWGADALSAVLQFRFEITRDPQLLPYIRSLASAGPAYGPPCQSQACGQWSDVPAWDAVAALRAYQLGGHNLLVLQKARDAYSFTTQGTAYVQGACPQIFYQQPLGGPNQVKTLETDANVIRAALLLYEATGNVHYLGEATRRYATVRHFFLDAKLPLYSVYVFDDGHACRQLHHRFFASVNGIMILNGLMLNRFTHQQMYRRDAIETGHAIDDNLADDRNVFADLQADNDVVEPLIEAMYALATVEHEEFASVWLLRNAAAAGAAHDADGNYGRFFDGPPPVSGVTAWQTNGGFALMVAAAALDPHGTPAGDRWPEARTVHAEFSALPALIRFTGRAIALTGTIGEVCCEAGHAAVFVDGHETFDHTGIWQNKSNTGRPLPDAVLFAWQWPTAGRHVLRIVPGIANAKEGGAFIHLRGYVVR